MKKILGFMTLCVIVMASCQKETETTEQAIASTLDVNALPASDPTNDPNTYEMGRKHRPGKDQEFTKIPLDQLSQSIKDYVAQNYPDATIEAAMTDKAGFFYTIIKFADGSVKILQFDANGNFVKELDRKHKGPKDPRKKLTNVDPANLLPVITTYIETTYSGAIIKRAGSTPNGDFIVVIDFNGEHKVLLFDATGNFIKELK
jgi:hypothetical protein